MKLFFAFYAVLSFASIISTYKNKKLYSYLKGLPVFSLILFLIANNFNFNTNHIVILGLFFGLIGDLFLLNSEKYFKHGLFAFLTGHIFYTVFFLIHYNALKPFSVISLVVLFTIAFWLHLLRKIEKRLKLPVSLYILVITLMTISAVCSSLHILVKVGALLFLISDCILAFNKFVKKFYFAEAFILSTYYTAQLLIGFFAFFNLLK